MDTLYILFGLAIFIAVVLLLSGIYTTWNTSRGPEARRIARRLQAMSAGAHDGQQDTSILKKRLLSEAPGLQRMLQRVARVHSLDRLLLQSGVRINVAQFCLLSLACSVAALLMLTLLGVPLMLAVVPGAMAAVIPLLMVLARKRKRLARIEAQLPDALDLMSRALRAGHAFPSAVSMVGDEMADPVAGEFRIVFDEVNYGIPMPDALKNLSTRVPSTDVSYFVVAVLIQRETGGNLTELLGNIAAIVRERLKLFGQIRTFSAEGRLSAWILCLLPVGLVLVLQVINPHYMEVLWTDPFGRQMMMIMALFMVLGVFWMRKIIRIRV